MVRTLPREHSAYSWTWCEKYNQYMPRAHSWMSLWNSNIYWKVRSCSCIHWNNGFSDMNPLKCTISLCIESQVGCCWTLLRIRLLYCKMGEPLQRRSLPKSGLAVAPLSVDPNINGMMWCSRGFLVDPFEPWEPTIWSTVLSSWCNQPSFHAPVTFPLTKEWPGGRVTWYCGGFRSIFDKSVIDCEVPRESPIKMVPVYWAIIRLSLESGLVICLKRCRRRLLIQFNSYL
jgi:hypothetical protein